jgi:general secretion pathway protein G
MELLLVMSILVIMGGMVTFAFLKIGQNAAMDLTQTQINTFEQSCIRFKLNHSRFPNSLDDLVVVPSGMTERSWKGPYLDTNRIPLDQWGNPYTYSRDEAMNRVYIRSAGPDGQINTADDIPDPQASG